MRAFIFPGQGSQAVGMGKALADASPTARAVFQEVDEALGQNLFRLMCDGPESELTLTENAQPALMATSIAAMRALEAEGYGIGDAAYVAGHSLGEYSALCAAGAISLGDTARLLRIHAIDVNFTRLLKGRLNGLFRNFVKHNPLISVGITANRFF